MRLKQDLFDSVSVFNRHYIQISHFTQNHDRARLHSVIVLYGNVRNVYADDFEAFYWNMALSQIEKLQST